MKIIKRIALIVGLIFLSVVGGHLYFLSTLNATETYEEDTFLNAATKKRALVVMAHDDDACASSGTIAKLTQAGWDIKQISFQDGNEKRAKLYENIAAIIMNGGIQYINAPNEHYRKDENNKQKYMPIEKSQHQAIFHTHLIEERLRTAIAEFKPSIIFSLDDHVGGYGHPDHVFISSLVLNICQDQSLGIERIYQSVYPPSMEYNVNVKWNNMWNKFNVYEKAREVYQEPEGMPTPTCSINIYSVADKKMTYLSSFLKHEQKNLKKFIPGYHYYPSWLYFWLFNKEYFHVIEVSS
ncbi:MAG: PIG-L family deacetylase [Flammeovirgaceae bacterium]